MARGLEKRNKPPAESTRGAGLEDWVRKHFAQTHAKGQCGSSPNPATHDPSPVGDVAIASFAQWLQELPQPVREHLERDGFT